MIKDLIRGITITILISCIFALIGCSAKYHLTRFFKKGGQIEEKIKLVKFTDTLKIHGKDSLVDRWIPMTCPEPLAPETRYETRWKTKHLRANYKDSLAFLLKVEQLKSNNHKQTERSNRTNFRQNAKVEKSKSKPLSFLWWMFLGAVLMLVLQNVLRFLFFQFGIYSAMKKD
jgi:hypothetical protein